MYKLFQIIPNYSECLIGNHQRKSSEILYLCKTKPQYIQEELVISRQYSFSQISSENNIKNKNTMKTKSFIAMVIVLLFTLASCQKDQDTRVITPASQELASDNPIENGDMDLKISSSTILNATSASQIPSRTFKVSSVYKDAYIHLK